MAPPIIEYMNLVKKYKTPKAKQVQEFLKSKGHDKVLTQRVEVLTKLMSLKDVLK
jgi:hypothetical protein